MKFEKILLNKLLDKYENSVVSKNGSLRNITVALKASDKVFIKYFSDDAYLYKDEIDAILEKLEMKNFISVNRDVNKEISSVKLNLSCIDVLYDKQNRPNPYKEQKAIKEYLNDFIEYDIPIGDFSKAMINHIDNHQSVLSYIDDLEHLKLYFKAIIAMQELEEAILKRNLSKRVFNDSKLFERIEGRVSKIIRDFSEDLEGLSNDEILEKHYIVKNPTFVYIKGDVIIQINNQIIDLKDLGYELSLNAEAVNNLIILECRTSNLITIENLTTFVDFQDSNFICIYLAGFHNAVKRNLLSKFKLSNPELDFYHFGDIDAGGFLILEDLINKTDIKFLRYKMDINTLEEYKDYWTLLSMNDKNRLQKLKGKGYDDVIEFMLHNNCKLEQEAIILNK